MPIHFPPLSRRAFLRRSLVLGVGLGCAPRWLAADERPAGDAWALLADTHVAADARQVQRQVNMSEHLAAATREIVARRERPAGVLVLGDCAFNRGEPEDYGQFTGLIKPLRAEGLPVYLTLGNHDQREHFRSALEPEAPATRPVADKQTAVVETKLVNWFLLDSLEKTLQTPGALGDAQLQWLAAVLDARPDKPAVVCLHHNPGLDGNLGLKDTARLWEVLRPRKQVKAWVYGHTHHWEVTRDESGIHLVNLPPVAYVFREGDPSGWVQAKLSAEGMTLELRSLDPQHAAHGKVKELKWRAG